MSENIKDLIEKAEEDEQNRAIMEKTIENLKMEVKTLKSKLEAQKEPFKPPSLKSEETKEDSEQIKILKDMVNSLREELNQKDQEQNKLNTKVKKLTSTLNQMKEKESDSIKEEILVKTQNSLNNLIEDYSRLEKINKNLKHKIAELEQESDDTLGPKDNDKIQTEGLKQEIETLRDQISNLEQKNQSLIQDIKLLEQKSSSSEQLDVLVEKLKKNNTLLEKENKELSEKLEELKREKLRILKYEKEIAELTEKITDLEEANKLLKKRDSILLAKTITAMDLPPDKLSKISTKQLIQEKALISKSVQEESIKSEKPSRIKDVVKEKHKIPIVKAIKPQKPKEVPKSREEPIETLEGELTRKWQCPHCGNTNKTQIRELNDKERPIWGNFYAKKYICGQCGKEWR